MDNSLQPEIALSIENVRNNWGTQPEWPIQGGSTRNG